MRWQEDAAAARKAAAERKAVAPAYAQLMHALCARGMHADALSVHALAGTHGVYAPGNPTHYRALFKALRGAGAAERGVYCCNVWAVRAGATCDETISVYGFGWLGVARERNRKRRG